MKDDGGINSPEGINLKEEEETNDDSSHEKRLVDSEDEWYTWSNYASDDISDSSGCEVQ